VEHRVWSDNGEGVVRIGKEIASVAVLLCNEIGQINDRYENLGEVDVLIKVR
jgi:hypothetical protein